jgi:hypothetical protein
MGAVLAGGAAAVLPAGASAASPAPQLSAVDRRVLDFWRRRQRVVSVRERLRAEQKAKEEQLPSWAKCGPVYLLPDGSPSKEHKAAAGWPIVVDLSRRPVINGVIKARPNAEDLYYEFKAMIAADVDWTTATHEFARTLGELNDRLRQQRAEKDRVGISPSHDERDEHVYDILHDIEDEIDELVPASVQALGAALIPRIERDDDEEEDRQRHRATLALIRPQLVGAIAEDADRVLASALKQEEDAPQ